MDMSANNLKEIRKMSGLSLDGLAKEVGTCKSHIHTLENSQTSPSLNLAYKISAILDRLCMKYGQIKMKLLKE
jgi:DNA-binding XRE family transcriptional regulator